MHELIKVVGERKKTYLRSLKGVRFDLLELGGGDASSTVISPKIFDEFVAPYDCQLIDLAHAMGSAFYHVRRHDAVPGTVAGLNPDAMETFTPANMGGVPIGQAKAHWR